MLQKKYILFDDFTITNKYNTSVAIVLNNVIFQLIFSAYFLDQLFLTFLPQWATFPGHFQVANQPLRNIWFVTSNLKMFINK